MSETLPIDPPADAPQPAATRRIGKRRRRRRVASKTRLLSARLVGALAWLSAFVTQLAALLAKLFGVAAVANGVPHLNLAVSLCKLGRGPEALAERSTATTLDPALGSRPFPPACG